MIFSLCLYLSYNGSEIQLAELFNQVLKGLKVTRVHIVWALEFSIIIQKACLDNLLLTE